MKIKLNKNGFWIGTKFEDIYEPAYEDQYTDQTHDTYLVINILPFISIFLDEYEQAHPETKRGSYLRSRDRNSKVHRNAFMPSFVEKYHKQLGIQKRALFNKIRIGEAILQNRFDEIQYLSYHKVQNYNFHYSE